MSIPFTKKIIVPKHMLVRIFEDDSVLLNLQRETYHGLDGMGTRMWQVLTQAPSIQDAYETLLSEYDVEPDRLKQDLEEFITKLADRGMIEVHDG